MARVYNFSAGPSMLPESVLKKAADEMLDYHGCGQSVMEMSHRSSQYEEIIGGCESLLRQTLQIPDDYDVLFLQGGASSQFAMVPMNLKKKGRADYVLTGQWAKKAFSEGKKFLTAHAVADSSDKTYTYIPKLDPADFDPEADYFHICYNNTIYGTRFHELPDTGNVPLVADMSSCILSEPVDIRRFGLVYAGAQKNMGPAGLTVVIVRKDLVGNAGPDVPTMFDYKTHADNGSMYNTPPCYAIYICKLVLEWIRDEMGGLEGMKAFNEKKAKRFYDYLDSSRLFHGTVEPADRSLMNIPFITGSDALNKQFIQQAEAAGFVNLKGHRTVGGMRASIYNAMPLEGVEKLCAFMKEFEEKNA